jgi:hypothetical protein
MLIQKSQVIVNKNPEKSYRFYFIVKGIKLKIL